MLQILLIMLCVADVVVVVFVVAINYATRDNLREVEFILLCSSKKSVITEVKS